MNRGARIALAGICLLRTLGLCVQYGATADQNRSHPTGEQSAETPGGWGGERVLLFGEVQERAADGAGGMPPYPLSWWRPSMPGYVSSERWVLVVAGGLVLAV